MVTIVFHHPKGRTETYVVYKEKYEEIVNLLKVVGSTMGRKKHFFIKDPNSQIVKDAICLASDGDAEVMVDACLPY